MKFILRKLSFGKRVVTPIADDELERMKAAGSAIPMADGGKTFFVEIEPPPAAAPNEYETTQMKPRGRKAKA